LTATFGPIEIAVPLARLTASEGGIGGIPPGQVVLALFGTAFHDERVRKLLAQIINEKKN